MLIAGVVFFGIFTLVGPGPTAGSRHAPSRYRHHRVRPGLGAAARRRVLGRRNLAHRGLLGSWASRSADGRAATSSCGCSTATSATNSGMRPACRRSSVRPWRPSSARDAVGRRRRRPVLGGRVPVGHTAVRSACRPAAVEGDEGRLDYEAAGDEASPSSPRAKPNTSLPIARGRSTGRMPRQTACSIRLFHARELVQPPVLAGQAGMLAPVQGRETSAEQIGARPSGRRTQMNATMDMMKERHVVVGHADEGHGSGDDAGRPALFACMQAASCADADAGEGTWAGARDGP